MLSENGYDDKDANGRITPSSISVLGGIVLGRHHKTPALPGPPVHSLYNVDHLLLVLHGPVDLVIVTSSKINHDVLVAEKEHAR